MKRSHLLLLTLIASPLLAQAAPQALAPGNWQTTVTMDMPGMPFTPPPRTMDICMKEHAGSPQSIQQLMQKSQRSDCKMDSFTFTGDQGHWKLTCGGRHPANGEGWITIKDDKHYQSKSQMTMHDTGNGVMTINTDAHWTGPCKP